MAGQFGDFSLRLAVATFAFMLSLAGAGCRGETAAEEALVFWAMGSEAEAADALLGGFRELHPDIPVRVQRVPWSAAHEKLLTAFVGGSMPDVFQLGSTWVAELAMLGALEPLDGRLAAAAGPSRDDFFPGVLGANVIDGRLLSLPWYVDTRLLFYRRDLLAAAGVMQPPRSWAQWRSAMELVRTSAGQGTSRYGVFLPVDEWQTPVILALEQQASLLAAGDTRGNFRSAEVRKAVEFYTGLFRDDLAPRRSEAQLANLYREFAAGYFAFFVTGPWNLVELERRMPADLADAWATAPMPAADASKGAAPGVSVAGGASLAVSATSTRKEHAFRLVEYLCSAPVQRQFRDLSGDLPSRRSAWDSAEVADAARASGTAGAGTAVAKGTAHHERSRAFRAQLDHLVTTPKVPEWERIAAKITLHLERIVRDEVGIDEGLAELDADVDAILAKRRALLAERP